MSAAVLPVGGWADGYTNTVDRALAGLTQAGVPFRGLVGPWSHGWPEIAEPGPDIGSLQECVRWWDHWLKGADNGAMDEPRLRVSMQQYAPPAARRRSHPGRWLGEAQWPSPEISGQRWFPRASGDLGVESAEPSTESIVGSTLAGSDAGAWCPYGLPTDFAPDQRSKDGRGLSFTSAPLSELVEILGMPVATLELTVDRPQALVAVRLCDVAPGGESLLVSRGLLNLCHRDGHTEPHNMPVGEPTVVSLPLDFAGHSFAPEHRIRVSVSRTYWPFAWPFPEPVTLDVHLGQRTVIELPVRRTSSRGRR